MPGFLYHLACAKIVADKKYAEDSEGYDRFLMGNLIPDLAEDYLAAHFEREVWAADIHQIVDSMNLKRAKEIVLGSRDPLLEGIYCHLYAEDISVVRTLGERFSDEAVGLELIESRLVPVDKIFTLPDELPEVGIKEFDARTELSWRDKIEEVLAERGEINRHNLKLVRRCLFQTANRFLEEELSDDSEDAVAVMEDFSKSA